MKYTLCITQQCNLACKYCYIGKRDARMPMKVAAKIIDFAIENTPADERIEIGFFGGEPLLEFDLIGEITGDIVNRREYDPNRFELSIVSNGTIFNDRIADFINTNDINFGISCDGPASVQNRFRRFKNGRESSVAIERNILMAVESLSCFQVNAVYHPDTFEYLPDVIDYFSDLGIRHIYLNPDISARWTADHLKKLQTIYDRVAGKYIDYYLQGQPHFISLIDYKISVIIRGGFKVQERCRMGRGEYAFTPEGRIYPCERLIGDGLNGDHCIGNIDDGIEIGKLLCNTVKGDDINDECITCGLKDYCVNWCGCSNFMASGYYNRVNPFLCVSEQATIKAAFSAFQTLEKKLGPTFAEHLNGYPFANCRSDK